MDDREYLRSLGFTVGERGRFSKQMLDALAERNGETASLIKESEAEAVGLNKSIIREPLRQPEEIIGYDVEGRKIAFVLCAECAMHMMWCECDGGVLAPSYIVSSKNPLVRFSS